MASPLENKAWGIPSHASSVKHLTELSLPLPVPGPNQVLVRLTATTLNYRDLLVVTHSPAYPLNHKENLIPTADGAGVIHLAGPASQWAGQEGTKVILQPNTWLSGNIRNMKLSEVYGASSIDGTLQKWMVVDDERIIVAPTGLTAAESASLITAGVPAWCAIRESLDGRFDGQIAPWANEKTLEGKTILTMGTGGVSCFAIQIASALGATVIVTSSSDKKLARCKELGATYLINYITTPDWDREVLRITGGGVDHVIELGGCETLEKSVNSTRAGGLISVIGILSDSKDLPAALVPSILFGGKIVKGCVGFSRDSTAEFARWIEKRNVKPIVAKEYTFEEAIKAFEALQEQKFIGKIAIKISNE